MFIHGLRDSITVRSFLLVLASNLDFEIIKMKLTNSHETRMGLALLVWRDVIYTM